MEQSVSGAMVTPKPEVTKFRIAAKGELFVHACNELHHLNDSTLRDLRYNRNKLDRVPRGYSPKQLFRTER